MKQREIRIEDLRQDFPEMPAELRRMVESEVQRQVDTVSQGRRRKHMAKKTIIAALAATMLLGTTVFAGIVYKMHTEPVGKYAMNTSISTDAGDPGKSGAAAGEQTQAVSDISDVRMTVSYLPEGMVDVGDGKYSYADNLYKGGVSVTFYKMDTGDAQFEMLTTDVRESEHVSVGGHEGVYFLLHGGEDEEVSFNQRMYVAYTDVHYVMEMYAASDVSREDVLKIAEGIRLEPVDDESAQDIVHAYEWSVYLASRSETAVDWNPPEPVPKSEMADIHAIGESFAAAPKDDWRGLGNVAVKVTDVQVSDNVSLLDESVLDSDGKEDLRKETDASGKLLPVRIDYIRYGDGINSLNEVVCSREVPQKLVYVTVEYTNTGSEELDEVLFFGSLMKIIERGGQMELYRGNAPCEDAEWDEAVPRGAARYGEMWYYDVHGGERHNNYITNLKAGETATVHMAWLVPEEELDCLYLNLDTHGGAYEIDPAGIGYVDIRQQGGE